MLRNKANSDISQVAIKIASKRENECCTYGDGVTPVKKNLFMVTAYMQITTSSISFLEADIYFQVEKPFYYRKGYTIRY